MEEIAGDHKSIYIKTTGRERLLALYSLNEEAANGSCIHPLGHSDGLGNDRAMKMQYLSIVAKLLDLVRRRAVSYQDLFRSSNLFDGWVWIQSQMKHGMLSPCEIL